MSADPNGYPWTDEVWLDRRTGRPVGDHGTHAQAMTYALDILEDGEAEPFLRRWQTGATANEDLPFYAWLKGQPA